MVSDYQRAKHSARIKAHHRLGTYARGGRIGHDGDGIDPEEREIEPAGAVTTIKSPKKFKAGGRVEGEKGKERLDRKARGGKVSNPMGPAHAITEYPKKRLNKAPDQVESEGEKTYKGDGYKRGGRTKGGHTHVNIMVGGQQGQGGGADAQTAFKAGVLKGAQAAKAAIAGGPQQGAPMMPPGGGMPPGGAPMPPGGAPMPPRPPMAPPGGGMPPGGPPMMRKAGGRVNQPVGGTLPLAKAMSSGSGGGKGRLTKAGFYQGKK